MDRTWEKVVASLTQGLGFMVTHCPEVELMGMEVGLQVFQEFYSTATCRFASFMVARGLEGNYIRDTLREGELAAAVAAAVVAADMPAALCSSCGSSRHASSSEQQLWQQLWQQQTCQQL